ncbi:MAG: pyruvate kinase [Armatimonadetes bacterium]|nr:pyruvate kinase [Armatimonadota bacterium]
MLKRRTKIVCTLGPSTATKAMITALVKEGMNVARLNCSHGDWESKREQMGWIKEAEQDIAPIAIMADLQGPKFRLGVLKGDKLNLKAGQTVTLGPVESDLPVPSHELVANMQKGDRILFGDGNVEVRLGNPIEGGFEAKVSAGGEVKTKQGITLVGRSFDVPALTSKDLMDVQEAVKSGVDYVALSYVRSAADMRELRQIVSKLDPTVRLVAKVETKEALKDIDEIIKSSDVVMVARGDLGLQMEIEEVPAAQKKIIQKCNQAGIPVITATQMLESMVTNARPTRAEASDVANAIMDGTDAIMLSGETAAGQYPRESVRTMVKIAEKTEPLRVWQRDQSLTSGSEFHTDVVAQSAVNIAHGLKVRAILTASTSGMTPRMVSKYKPNVPIFCACWSEKVQRQLAMVGGVHAIVIDPPLNTDDAIRATMNGFLRRKQIKVGDTVVITAGVPVGHPGKTNLIEVLTV